MVRSRGPDRSSLEAVRRRQAADSSRSQKTQTTSDSSRLAVTRLQWSSGSGSERARVRPAAPSRRQRSSRTLTVFNPCSHTLALPSLRAPERRASPSSPSSDAPSDRVAAETGRRLEPPTPDLGPACPEKRRDPLSEGIFQPSTRSIIVSFRPLGAAPTQWTESLRRRMSNGPELGVSLRRPDRPPNPWSRWSPNRGNSSKGYGEKSIFSPS